MLFPVLSRTEWNDIVNPQILATYRKLIDPEPPFLLLVEAAQSEYRVASCIGEGKHDLPTQTGFQKAAV
jgi:hypothetical protein